MGEKVYLKLEKSSFLYNFFAYLDVAEYLADNLFAKHQVTVRFGEEWSTPDSEYRIILCRVRKRDTRRFLDALEELPKKMLICGYADYPAYVERLFEKMRLDLERERSGRNGDEFCASEETKQEAPA